MFYAVGEVAVTALVKRLVSILVFDGSYMLVLDDIARVAEALGQFGALLNLAVDKKESGLFRPLFAVF